MLNKPARQLLDRPGVLGVVCTLRSDVSPQANPVWFRRAGNDIRIWTDDARRWVTNLRHAPQVAFSVHENASPWRSVTIRGSAELDGLAPGEAMDEIRRICARYLAPDDIEAYVEEWPQTRSIVTIHAAAVFAAQAFEDPVAHRRP